MPGPPPPPPAAPPPMMPPPPPIFNPTPSKGGGDDRSALLKSIRQGTKLKKTVTNDKSAPVIGKVTNSMSSQNNAAAGNHTSHNSNVSSVPNDLGNLFAGGMPKLRPTGRNLGEKQSNHVNASNHSNNNLSNSSSVSNTRQKSPDVQSQTAKSFTSIQNELKKQMASDNRNRGPPPPAPVRNNSDLSNSRHPFVMKNGSVNGLHKNMSTTQPSSLYPNSSTLHRKANSSVNLNPVDGVELPTINNNLPAKPVINHGKPHLAPKPPLNGKPAAPPKKLIMNGKPISRAQSMKSPRSPSPQSPDNNITAAIKFGTVRNLTAVVNQSLANSTGNLSSPRQRPPIATRPNAPPPSIPQHNNVQQPPPPPSKISMVKPPNHAPPPPPNAPLPQPPNHAPPLPPHRTGPVRGAPAIPQNNAVAPPPPPRHSSIRDGNATTRRPTPHYVDLEVKFAKEFHSVSQFPKPGPYIGFFKTYRSKQESKC